MSPNCNHFPSLIVSFELFFVRSRGEGTPKSKQTNLLNYLSSPVPHSCKIGPQSQTPPLWQVTMATAVTWTASAWHHWSTSTCPSSAPSAVCGRSPPRTRRSTIRWTSWTSREGNRPERFSPRLKLQQVSRWFSSGKQSFNRVSNSTTFKND